MSKHTACVCFGNCFAFADNVFSSIFNSADQMLIDDAIANLPEQNFLDLATETKIVIPAEGLHPALTVAILNDSLAPLAELFYMDTFRRE